MERKFINLHLTADEIKHLIGNLEYTIGIDDTSQVLDIHLIEYFKSLLKSWENTASGEQ